VSNDEARASRLQELQIVAEYVVGRLEDMVKERDRADARSSLIVSSSGGLITVGAVLAALLPRPNESYRYPTLLIILLAIVMVLFLAAVLVAQYSAWKLDANYRRSTLFKSGLSADETLQSAIEGATEEAQELVKWNGWRAKRLFLAATCQMIGVIGLFVSVATFLYSVAVGA
jgi:hypothetical protein